MEKKPTPNVSTTSEPGKNPKLLILGDSAAIQTGFGRVAYEIGTRLQDRYEIHQQGWNHHPDNITHDVPWTIYQTRIDPRTGQHLLSDVYGQQTVIDVLNLVKPDIVLLIGDPWRFECLKSIPNRDFGVVIYTAIDSAPFPKEFHWLLDCCDRFVVFGDWAHNIITQDPRFESKTPVCKVAHGVNSTTYKNTITSADRDYCRERIQTYPDDFLLLSVARNQPRKNLGRMFQMMWHLVYGEYRVEEDGSVVLSRFDPVRRTAQNSVEGRAEPMPNLKLFINAASPDLGWDFAELADRYGLVDNVFWIPERTPLNGLSDEELSLLYQAADAFTLPTHCEGFGIPILEAMACNLPVIVPNFSAYTDWVPTKNWLVDGEIFIAPKYNTERMEISMRDYVAKTLDCVLDKERRDEVAKENRRVAEKMDWNFIANDMDTVLSDVLNGKVSAITPIQL